MTASVLAADCAHSSDHLTRDMLRNALSNGTTTSAVVIWTGHILTNNAPSNASLSRNSVVITPQGLALPNDNYANAPAWVIRTFSETALMHELSHLFDVPDHYCYHVGVSSEDPCENSNCDICVKGKEYVRECLMTNEVRDFSTVFEEWLYCDECEITIEEHLRDHH